MQILYSTHLTIMQEAYKSPELPGLFPEKLFYKIGEVSKIVGVEPYVLRFWETEFPILSPRKSRSGQRIYTKKDIDMLLQIKKLLYEEKYTIDGARRKLNGEELRIEEKSERQEKVTEGLEHLDSVNEKIVMIKERLREILNSL